MQNIMQHRRQRLAELIAMTYHNLRGAKNMAAERIGCDASYLSRIASGDRNMGEEFRSKIEDGFGLPTGWIDLPLGTPLKPSLDPSPTPTHYNNEPAISAADQQSAMEASPSYSAPWPFSSIRPTEWLSLTVSQRIHAEICLRNLLNCVQQTTSTG